MTDRRAAPLVVLVVGVAYYAASELGLAFVAHPGHVAVVWPASGIAFAAALLAPARWAPAIAAGVFAGNLLAQLGARPGVALAVALAAVNAAEPLLGAAVARHRRGAGLPAWDGVRGLQSVLLGAVVSAASAGLAGALALGATVGSPVLAGWATWSLADGLGMVFVVPVLLRLGGRRGDAAGDAVGYALAATAILVGCAVFAVPRALDVVVLDYPYATFPFLVWVAVRGQRGPTMLATSGVGLVAVLGTVGGRGPFAEVAGGLDAVVAVQGFLAVVLVGVALTSAIVGERRSAAVAALDGAERYRQLVGAMPDAICALFDADLRLELLDGTSPASLGVDTTALIGRPLHAVVSKERLAVLEPLFRRALDGETVRLDHDSSFTGTAGELEIAPRRDPEGRVTGVFVLARDVTDRRRQEHALRKMHDDFRAMFEAATIAQLVIGPDGLVSRANAALVRLVDGGRPEGAPLGAVVGEEHARCVRERVDLVRDGGVPDGELELTTETGATVTVHACAMSGGQVLVQLVDVTERRRYEGELRHLADHDSLTGLANRRRFEEELARQLDQVRRYGDIGAVCVLDIDHFKQVNDTLGHKVGDDLIVAISRLLSGRLRASDVLARLGGDEFAVLLPRATAADAETVAGELVRVVREHAGGIEGVRPRDVTVSVGVAVVDGDRPGITAEELMVEADLAMYDAKSAGRDRFAVFSDGRVHESRTKVQIEWVERIETALRTDGFVLLAQPIEDLSTGAVDRHELLLRMIDDGDLIPPAAFLPVAERHGLAPRIDRWVLSRALELLERIADAGGSHRFEVNVSGRSLSDDGLLRHIERELRRTGVDPRALIIEITETAAIADIAAAREFVERLTRIGCRFALDDFGAGFGSFYYLKHLPSDYLKIDGEFVRGCATSHDDRVVIRSLVAVARGMNKRTIAEFVTDEAVLRCVTDLGVDLAQGFHIGRPAPVDLDELLGRASTAPAAPRAAARR
ncbi:bifunctional diguanylate cyclase/phosphodiesterase [Patulibacter minatonensis]|uniref:bifunctional diguanylate cyclase/phosphodiesterase n=1 Tax=Patulibacter minatonensis TaxID=298163 RepID=UPI000684D38B|nr:EAL domain-containing protein [Patulibacter minatonensis]